MPRFALACFLEPQPIGSELLLAALPLHVTLIGGFVLDRKPELIVSALPTSPAFELVVGASELFGPDRDIPVTVFADEHGIRSYHRRVLAAVLELGATVNSPEYVGDGFRPHITMNSPHVPARGEPARLESMSLLNLNDSKALVIADIPFLSS